MIRVVQQVPAAATDDRPTIVTTGALSSSSTELSIAAQRARQELKVEREKMGLVRLQDKIEADEAKLNDLKREESRQEVVRNSFFSVAVILWLWFVVVVVV